MFLKLSSYHLIELGPPLILFLCANLSVDPALVVRPFDGSVRYTNPVGSGID